VNVALALTATAEKNSIQEGVPAKSIGEVGEQCRTDWARFKQRYVDLARSYRGDVKRID
jgi:carbonic anhydrase/acetyltransferase-like protein (isoleucine patch superfamily)